MVAIVAEVYGAVCQLYLIKTLEHDSGDIKAFRSQSIYMYLYVPPYIVDSAGYYINLGREGSIYYLSSFSC